MQNEDIELIHEFVDEGLRKLKEHDLMWTPGLVPFEMVDSSYPKKDDWTHWKATRSTVTNKEITQLEVLANCEFPISFTTFLKYKHFYELDLPNGELVSFYKHPIKTWLNEFIRMYSYDWVQDDLISQGFVPFANHYDHGLLCFDARKKHKNNEYPILMVDHELVTENKEYEYFNSCFMEMVKEKLI